MKNLLKLKKELKKKGTVLISGDKSFINNKDFTKIETNLKKLPKEFISIGDAGEKNHVVVSRLMTDIKKPIMVNKRYSKIIIDILKRKYFQELKFLCNIKSNVYIRRAQLNIMRKNCFVGKHLDIDSNLDYLYAVIIQLGTKFSGGDYRVHKKNKFFDFKPRYKSIMISDCKIPHEVRAVRSGKRSSFVFFLSKQNKKNKRIH